ncbi:hypothetical protein D3C73_1273740 [compost metagenome]
MAVGHANHGVVEIGFLVAQRVVHGAIGRARYAFGDVAGTFVVRHGLSLLSASGRGHGERTREAGSLACESSVLAGYYHSTSLCRAEHAAISKIRSRSLADRAACHPLVRADVFGGLRPGVRAWSPPHHQRAHHIAECARPGRPDFL